MPMPGYSLDGAPNMATDPGFDAQPKPVSYWVDGLLAAVGGDGIVDPEEVREVQRLMAGLQAIGAQRQAAMGQQPMGPPSNDTSAFGSAEGAEDVPEYGAQPGAEFTTSM